MDGKSERDSAKRTQSTEIVEEPDFWTGWGMDGEWIRCPPKFQRRRKPSGLRTSKDSRPLCGATVGLDLAEHEEEGYSTS